MTIFDDLIREYAGSRTGTDTDMPSLADAQAVTAGLANYLAELAANPLIRVIAERGLGHGLTPADVELIAGMAVRLENQTPFRPADAPQVTP